MSAPGITIGRYRLFGKIGTGGMGTVHLARFFGPGGFRRMVAIKRLHPQYAEDDDFVGAFLDEARLASRIHHPNVVASIDVVAEGGEVFLVFEHVPGVALSSLLANVRKRGETVPAGVAVAVMLQVLHGLQAAHDAKGDLGEPLGLVHRDVSPQNVLVGRDGAARLLDFGVAKAAGRSQHTEEGVVKGKRGYMAPEHLLGKATQASDVYSAAVVLWEFVAGRRLFPDDGSIAARLSHERVPAPSELEGGASSAALDAIVLRGLAPDVATRFASASDMAMALEAVGAASAREVGVWVERIAEAELAARDRLVEQAEQASHAPPPPVTATPAAPGAVVTISDEPPIAVRPAPARRLYWGLAFVAIAAGLLLFANRARAPAGEAVADGLAVRPTAVVAAVSSSEPRDDSSAAPPVAQEVPASATPTVATKSTAPAPAKARPSQAKRPAPACKPYVTDANGRKTFNEACLR